MRNIIKYVGLVLFVCSLVIGINYQYPNHLQYVNNKVLDIFFNSRDNINIGNNIAIIDIDDRSLNQIGQWPWSRNVFSKLVKNLNKLSPSSIGFNIMFLEEDRTSPSNLSIKSNIKLENYDETFAISLEESDVPTILQYRFINTDEIIENHETPYVPAVFKNKVNPKYLRLNRFNYMQLNIPIIQDSAYSSGFLNFKSDENGRQVNAPLLIEYVDKDNNVQLFPSFSLEIIRTIYSSRKIDLIREDNLGNFIKFGNIKIPVDDEGSLFINYINSKKKFKHISAIDILNKNFSNFERSDISGKIVLVGSSALGLASFTPTPFNTDISDIDMQANIIENILTEKFLIHPVWEENFQIIITILISMIILTSIFYGSALTNILVSLLTAFGVYYIFKDQFDSNGYLIDSTFAIETILIAMILSIITHLIQNKMDMLNIKGKFASKVSKQVMEDLLDNSKKKGDKSSKRKYITIFFSDIKAFTKITEKINDPNLLTKFINRYMDYMTKNIMLSEGTVDKFMGDAIMAYWNAPYDVDNHEDLAVTSAVEQIELLTEINHQNIEEGLPTISIRIGINTGEAFVGEVGGELRSDYTVMGKAVNHTAVLEQVGKYYGASIIISQSVKDGLKNEYTMMLIDIIKVDGTSDAFNIYQVFSLGEPDEFVLEEISSFEQAIMLYRNAMFDDAILILRNLYSRDILLNKKICDIYIQRCKENIEIGQRKNFDPTLCINKSVISGA